MTEQQDTRGAIMAAINRWYIDVGASLDSAGCPAATPLTYDGWPDIEGVGIPAIDNALQYLKPDTLKPRHTFLVIMESLLQEKPDALEMSERRKVPVQEAVRLIREAAALMGEADNPPLETLLCSIAEQAEKARYGTVFPQAIYADGDAIKLHVSYEPDALSGMCAGKRGGKSSDANIVKMIARRFPDSQEFLSTSNGYSTIARLAVLCGLKNKNPNAYVRSVLESNKSTAKKATPKPHRDNSIAALLTGNKPT